MLFDPSVVKVIEANFVPVITDHPRGGTSPKRNAETWTRCESWKRSPNSAEIVWLVSADASRRDGLNYSRLKEPADLLAWMEAVLVFDGRVEEPTAEQTRRATLLHLRQALDMLWQWRGPGDMPKEFRQQRTDFDAVAATVGDDELCPADAAKDLLPRLRAPTDTWRSELRTQLGQLIAFVRDVDLVDAAWFDVFAERQKADELGGVAEQLAAVRMLQSMLRHAVREGRLKPSAEQSSELVRLGVVLGRGD